MTRILILDNSVDLLYALKIFFERKGYKAKTLTSDINLISEVKNFKPDVVMLDVILNGVDAKEICKTIRNCADIRKVRLLLTSAFPAKFAEYKQYLADDFIEKPFDLYKLEQKIKSMLLLTKNEATSYKGVGETKSNLLLLKAN
ncbi:MAG: response regulator [Bacteroidota bacterium]|nr:response regulator [Bacteroidota bacterium]